MVREAVPGNGPLGLTTRFGLHVLEHWQSIWFRNGPVEISQHTKSSKFLLLQSSMVLNVLKREDCRSWEVPEHAKIIAIETFGTY